MNEHVVAALSRPELAPLVAELTRRMGASDRAVVSVQVQLDHAGREALAGLLGATRIPPSPARVKIADLIRRLDTDTDGLRRALEKVSGPIGNRAAERQTRRDAVAAAADDAAAAAEPLGPSLQAWARVTVSSLTGPVDKRLADVGCVLAVVAEPRDRPQPLPVVAAKALRDVTSQVCSRGKRDWSATVRAEGCKTGVWTRMCGLRSWKRRTGCCGSG